MEPWVRRGPVYLVGFPSERILFCCALLAKHTKSIIGVTFVAFVEADLGGMSFYHGVKGSPSESEDVDSFSKLPGKTEQGPQASC